MSAARGPAELSREHLLSDVEAELAAAPGAWPEELFAIVRTFGDLRGPPAPLVSAASESSSPGLRLAALDELGALGTGRRPPSFEECSAALLIEKDRLTDEEALRALEAGPDLVRAAVLARARAERRTALADAVCELLDRSSGLPWLERACLRTLGVIGSESSLSRLLPALRSPDGATVSAALETVVAIGTPMAAGLLGRLLQDRSCHRPEEVARALHLLDPKRGGAGRSRDPALRSSQPAAAEGQAAERASAGAAPARAAGSGRWWLLGLALTALGIQVYLVMPAPPAGAPETDRPARIETLRGRVYQIDSPGVTRVLMRGDTLGAGRLLETSTDSRVSLMLPEPGFRLVLGASARATLQPRSAAPPPAGYLVEVERGEVLLEPHAPLGLVELRQGGLRIVLREARALLRAGRLHVSEGSASIYRDKAPVAEVPAGWAIELGRSDGPDAASRFEDHEVDWEPR